VTRVGVSCMLSTETRRCSPRRAMARGRRALPPPPLVGLAVLLSVAAAKTDQADGAGWLVLVLLSVYASFLILRIVCSVGFLFCFVSVAALNVMFNSLNKPSKLSGWKENGGDPCDDDDTWKGIECSGSSVTEMCVIAFNILL
jgi:hypothetical protein